MSLFLGVDAGGTNTTYVLADEHRELARAQGRSIKRIRVTEEEAHHSLCEAVSSLEQNSGIHLSGVDSVCIGTAGETVPLVTEWIRKEFTLLTPHARLQLLGDVEIALEAAFPGARGVLVLAGTGSNVCGRTSTGQMFRVGGWGPAIGDQGAGYWIGREGLRRAFLAMDRGESTLLMPAIAAMWNVKTIEEIISYAHTTPPPDFARLSRIVADCADEGDSVARSVLRQAGQDLAELASLVLKRVSESDGEPLAGVGIAGSILKRVELVRQSMTEALHRLSPAIEVRQEGVDPVLGALWRARQIWT